MIRAIFELLVITLLAVVARAILTSLMKGFSNAARGGFSPNPPAQSPPPQQPKENVRVAGELHKDPVCGMYVTESTRFQRRSGRENFYYCSENCKDKHALATR